MIGAVATAAAALSTVQRLHAQGDPWALRLVRAARTQVGETLIYDPAYVRIGFPGGDVPRDRGVCTDVIVRAYRDGLGTDLQKLLNDDMRRNFSSYPRQWGLAGPDRNIDHRRVPNLRTFFRRRGAEIEPGSADYLAGDVVSQLLPGNLAHIVIVSDIAGRDPKVPMVIHNIGAGARIEDRLIEFEITGHYRFSGL